MVKIKSGQKGEIKWSILKTACNEKEDFSKAVMCVFLVGNDNKIPYSPKAMMLQVEDDEEHAMTGEIPSSASVLEYEVVNNVIVAQIPTTISDGVYGIEAIWYKDNQCKKTYAKVSDVFLVTDEAQIHEGNAVIRITSKAATYGYDGIDSYELAVLLGKTSLDRNSWVDNMCEANDKINMAVQLASDAAEDAERASNLAYSAADKASKAVADASGIEIDTVNNLLMYKDRIYELTLSSSGGGSGQGSSTIPSGDKVVDKIVWGKPVVTLEYNSQLPSAGGEISTRTFTYYQVKTVTYKNGYPAEQSWYYDDKNVSVVWGGEAGAEGKFTIEANKSGQTREFIVTVKVTANGVESDEVKLKLLQPSMIATGTTYRNLNLTLKYQDAEASGGTIYPSAFTYAIDSVTSYNVAGYDDVDTISGNVTAEDIEKWENTNNINTPALTVPASTITERHMLSNKVKAYVTIYGVTKVVECEVWQKASSKTVASTVYTNLVVDLSYGTIPATGGNATPVLTYSYIKTINYSNGESASQTVRNEGGTVVYKDKATQTVITGGQFNVDASQSATETSVKTIQATVTVGEGQGSVTDTQEFVVKQAGTGATTKYMYIGSSAALPTTDAGIEVANNKKDLKAGSYAVETISSEHMRCHYVAIKKTDSFKVLRAIDCLGQSIADLLTITEIGSYKVWAYVSQGAYIENTTTFTVVETV